MMRNRFDEQLNVLNSEMIRMGALCEEVIALAAKALGDGDASLAKKVAPLDAEIDEKERSIETLCLRLLLQQQPVARDLRQISAALKMVTDMERIGDQAEDIAEIVLFLNGCRANTTAFFSRWRARPSRWSQTASTRLSSAIRALPNGSSARTIRSTSILTRSSNL